MDGIQDYSGKNVVVILVNKFRKFGLLKSIDATGLILVSYDGKEEYIPLVSVASIGLDYRVAQ